MVFKSKFNHFSSSSSLFTEARTHGVGYYEFSTDESERAKQRKEFDALRNVTLVEQKKREEQKMAREKIIAERVKAAKNRQRARQGLPPEEEEIIPTKSEETIANEQDLYDKSEEAIKLKAEAAEKKKKEKAERKREKERQNHIRPWDKGKQKGDSSGRRGVSDDDEDGDGSDEEWKYKVVKEPMSQEQWNVEKRVERPKEFAPHYYANQPQQSITPIFDLSRPPPPLPSTLHEEDNRSLFFTSKKKQPPSSTVTQSSGVFYQRNAQPPPPSAPPITELPRRGGGTEIAPPPTFDYYGPSASKQKRSTLSGGGGQTKTQLETSIDAGLRFLRDQSDKGHAGSKRTWTTNADY